MIIEKIILNNIRTYLEDEIVFDKSSVLLSGDIGSGKSTILLAMEFALFGLSRGKLTGDSLLRKGSPECFVELFFNIDDKKYSIRRGLKRTSQGIQQTTGYIIKDGLKEEGTSIELRTRIIDILGYPASLKKSITSSKHFTIFRYTVYTPQEEVKKIIYDTDNRLDILKDVFDVDKYKLIKKNCDLYLRKLERDIYGYEIELNKLPSKEKEKELLETQVTQLQNDIKQINLEINTILENKEIIEKELRNIEDKKEELNKLNHQFELKDSELRILVNEISSNNKEILYLEKSTDELEKSLTDIKEMDESKLILNKKEIQLKIKDLESSLIINKEKIAISNDQIIKSKEIIDKISSLDHCPLCLQDVSATHKKEVILVEEGKIKPLQIDIQKLKDDNDLNIKQRKDLELELESLDSKINKTRINRLKKENLETNKNQLSKKIDKISELKQRVGNINQQKLVLNEEIEKYKDINEKYASIKSSYDKLVSDEKQKLILKREYETKKNLYGNEISKFSSEIDRLVKIKLELNKKRSLRNWLRNHFLMLVDLIENHVMVKIQQMFDIHFQQWFNFLIENESMSGRLDEKFTPIIESDGYEISFNDLSGGEKTSVALAYRLSLNKVINDMISGMKTKDFIILDEPTTGFSSEQLDKLKEVLDQINVSQMILVSHETKIESFVKKVIRISKNENVSHHLELDND